MTRTCKTSHSVCKRRPLPIHFHEVVTVVLMKESPISEAIQKPHEITVGRTVINGSFLHEPPGETYFHYVTSNYIVPIFL